MLFFLQQHRLLVLLLCLGSGSLLAQGEGGSLSSASGEAKNVSEAKSEIFAAEVKPEKIEKLEALLEKEKEQAAAVVDAKVNASSDNVTSVANAVSAVGVAPTNNESTSSAAVDATSKENIQEKVVDAAKENVSVATAAVTSDAVPASAAPTEMSKNSSTAETTANDQAATDTKPNSAEVASNTAPSTEANTNISAAPVSTAKEQIVVSPPSKTTADSLSEEASAAKQQAEENQAAEAKQAEIRQAEAREAEAKQAEARQAEIRQAEARAAEAKQAEAKQAEIRQAEARAAEAKQAEAREAEAKQVEARQAEIRQAEARAAEARQAEIRQAEIKQAEIKRVPKVAAMMLTDQTATQVAAVPTARSSCESPDVASPELDVCRRWKINVSDVNVRLLLTRWSREIGWQPPVWSLPVDIPIDSNSELVGNFEDVLNRLAQTLYTTDTQVQMTLYSNRVLRVEPFLRAPASVRQ